MHLDGTLKFSLGQATFAGVKSDNEDSIGIRIPEGHLLTTKGAVAIIADGVSAAEAGKEASDTCVTSFLSDYFSTPESWTVKKSTQQVLNALNRWLYGQGQRFLQPEKGYVCTLSLVIFKSRTAHIFHVGDTRVYRYRQGELEQVTRDHATRINKEQSYLTRAMGLDMWLDVDYRTVDLEEGDVFLLTSDGVHDFLSRAELRERLGHLSADLEEDCNTMIASALENGSHDNLSAQLIRVDRLPSEEADDAFLKLTELPFPPPLSVGMTVDGFLIEKELHASSRSQLYLVQDTRSNDPARYVMKTPSVNFVDDAAYIERFIMEGWIGRRIDSPHVVRVLDEDRERSCLYYLAEYVEGETLEQWIKRHPKPNIHSVMDIAEQLIKGVRAFHRRETWHQDIRPANIMIDDQGHVTLVDFGSCFVGGVAEISTVIERDAILGTAQYSAPEQILRRQVTAAADQFSVAVVLYEMLTGKLPFEGQLEHCTSIAAYSRLSYVPAYHYNPLVPTWMDAAIRKALSISPELRYQDVSELLHDLQNPNRDFVQQASRPLAQRNPLRFWQVVAAVLFVTQIITLGMLF
ncbi:serine/threonine protein kinase/serine/threonine protein phosphatase PrpC [Litorivivens lipolytica]|uniref:Serine/threonine protein kinase/serine/threonine protein phosphatase PrpC n=1 Tax=Litorivivens lipolytica TaxID=1524264 RepID=A0A7W4W5M2_9GAMM|nr:bifunctional protein-serine/threonine kinase/phosphatase [Litorivivens lipolytica]MBB3047902.1 serine/threonine protein kinase/serine/threonine protein phosphatase PrpC [Litorivivens lipolytica]